MSFGPACERCGCCSYEGSMDERPVRCPFCCKPKRRGSREELVDHFGRMLNFLYALRDNEDISGQRLEDAKRIISEAEDV